MFCWLRIFIIALMLYAGSYKLSSLYYREISRALPETLDSYYINIRYDVYFPITWLLFNEYRLRGLEVRDERAWYEGSAFSDGRWHHNFRPFSDALHSSYGMEFSYDVQIDKQLEERLMNVERGAYLQLDIRRDVKDDRPVTAWRLHSFDVVNLGADPTALPQNLKGKSLLYGRSIEKRVLKYI